MTARLVLLAFVVLCGATACAPAKVAHCSIALSKSHYTIVQADVTNKSSKPILTTSIVFTSGNNTAAYTFPALIAPGQTVGVSQIRAASPTHVPYGTTDCKLQTLKYSDGTVWRSPSPR